MILSLKDYEPNTGIKTIVDVTGDGCRTTLIVRGASGVEVIAHKTEVAYGQATRYSVSVTYADGTSAFFTGKPGGDEHRFFVEAAEQFKKEQV